MRGPRFAVAPAALALAALLAAAAPAPAAPRVRMDVPRAVDADCSAAARGGAGVASSSLRAARNGYLTARLRARRGDWDLAVFRAGQRRPVAASAYRGAREVASGFVRRGDRLTLRACRRSGGAGTALVSVSIQHLGRAAFERVTLVRVATPTAALRRRLARMDLDVAEDAGGAFTSVLLHGRRDAARLRAAGLRFHRAPAVRAAVRARAAALPSGHTTYRRLAEYSNEMKALAAANPDIVRPITLPLTSRLGKPVEGLEITTNPAARDGKPVFLQVGLHHAREWPSGEHTLEWAYELVQGYRAGDPTTVSLMSRVRTIIVPVVNPDGFNFSREAGEAAGHGGGDNGFDSTSAEYHRKTCVAGGCFVSQGVDPNRNYGDLWGGPGTSGSPTSENYRGTAPFSEPESENIRRLISTRQVVVLITNHTFANEILRQPGIDSEPLTPDEDRFRDLGAAMAAQNGYDNVFSWQNGGGVNNHVGTTDGWSYYVTGGLGYVIEIGPSLFHPPFASMVAQYDGSAAPGDGNRGAYYVAMAAAANPALHAVLRGSAPAGAVLRVTKSFQNRTYGGSIPERLDTTMVVPSSGRFEWHMNQSGRPLARGETWTLTCTPPAGTAVTQPLAIARGQARELNPCVKPPSAPDGRLQPALRLRLVAGFDGRLYRARVSGRLLKVPDRERCDGIVKVRLRARSKQIRSRRAGLDEACAFTLRFKFRRGALPRALRRRGARLTLKAGAAWQGNEYLAPAAKSVRKRVRRRR